MSRLRLGELLAGAAGLLLAVTLFLDWYGVEQGRAPRSLAAVDTTAWSAMPIVAVVLLAAALAGIAVAVAAATRRTPGAPVAAGVIAAALGLLATLVALYRHVNEPSLGADLPNRIITIEGAAYLGMLASVGVMAGAWLALRDERPRGGEPHVEVEDRPLPPREAAPTAPGGQVGPPGPDEPDPATA